MGRKKPKAVADVNINDPQGADVLLLAIDPIPTNRMMRYRKNPQCPLCAAHPVVCETRRSGKAIFRCRQCGHRWELKT